MATEATELQTPPSDGDTASFRELGLLSSSQRLRGDFTTSGKNCRDKEILKKVLKSSLRRWERQRRSDGWVLRRANLDDWCSPRGLKSERSPLPAAAGGAAGKDVIQQRVSDISLLPKPCQSAGDARWQRSWRELAGN